MLELTRKIATFILALLWYNGYVGLDVSSGAASVPLHKKPHLAIRGEFVSMLARIPSFHVVAEIIDRPPRHRQSPQLRQGSPRRR